MSNPAHAFYFTFDNSIAQNDYYNSYLNIIKTGKPPL